MTRAHHGDRLSTLSAPFESGPFVWKMGVRPLDLNSWLVVDGDLHADRAAKALLLAERRAEVMIELDGSQGPSGVVHDWVLAALARAGVDRPSDTVSRHPLEAAGRLVQEDLVVMERRDQRWCLTAACVCFPTRWRLADKAGGSLASIHEPVPRYDTDLRSRTDHFFDRLRIERPVWRTNWTIDADWSARLEPGRTSVIDPTIEADSVAERLCLRLEYQTLRRLPGHDAVVFTIRIVRRPLGSVVSDGSAATLADALRSMPDDVAAYKAGSVAYRTEILQWLDRQSGHR